MAWTLPVLTKCCCCCGVKVGALIIGYISMFSSLISLASIATLIALVANYVKSENQKPNPIQTPEELAHGALLVYITYGIYLAVYLYYFVISLFIVIGVHKNKPLLLRYYVNTGLVLLVFAMALVVITVVFMGVLVALPQLCGSVILFYCVLVVRSALLEMEEENRPKDVHTLYGPQLAPLMV